MSRRRRGRDASFPIGRSLLLLAVLWGSLWAAGIGGAAAGAYVYDTRYAPPAPYTEEQLRSMERVSSPAADLARRDLDLWRETAEMGRSVARVEGALAGGMLMLAVWGALGAFWMWSRQRARGVDAVKLERVARV